MKGLRWVDDANRLSHARGSFFVLDLREGQPNPGRGFSLQIELRSHEGEREASVPTRWVGFLERPEVRFDLASEVTNPLLLSRIVFRRFQGDVELDAKSAQRLGVGNYSVRFPLGEEMSSKSHLGVEVQRRNTLEPLENLVSVRHPSIVLDQDEDVAERKDPVGQDRQDRDNHPDQEAGSNDLPHRDFLERRSDPDSGKGHIC